MKDYIPKVTEIERPDSTTIVFEVLFHKIRNEQELRNVLAGVDSNHIIPFATGGDPVSFASWLYFLIQPPGTPLSFCMKYVVPTDYMDTIKAEREAPTNE